MDKMFRANEQVGRIKSTVRKGKTDVSSVFSVSNRFTWKDSAPSTDAGLSDVLGKSLQTNILIARVFMLVAGMDEQASPRNWAMR